MNVTINGYVCYSCSSCRKSYTVEGNTFTFDEDSSPEAEDDGYIRYITQVDMPCETCGNKVFIKLDVWENPEAIVNYSYYSAKGVSDIKCEFTIEHYFDDEVARKEGSQDEVEIDAADEDDNDEKQFNETAAVEGYTDQYDHED